MDDLLRACSFANRLPDDTFWAAKQVMAFTDDEIRAIVATGGYSDPRTVAWITKCLIERRNTIGRVYFARVLPLEQFRIEGTTLRFENLATMHQVQPPVEPAISWHTFDNQRNQVGQQTLAQRAALPVQIGTSSPGTCARIVDAVPGQTVTVFCEERPPGRRLLALNEPGRRR